MPPSQISPRLSTTLLSLVPTTGDSRPCIGNGLQTPKVNIRQKKIVERNLGRLSICYSEMVSDNHGTCNRRALRTLCIGAHTL